MYAIDLIRRDSGTDEILVVGDTQPDAGTIEAAIATGRRVYENRGVELRAHGCPVDGFRITRRNSGDVVYTWHADA